MNPTAASPSPSESQVKKGLEGVVASETRVSDVDGARCQLIYRGYPIEELVGRASYEEVAFLLLRGRLPTASELLALKQDLAVRRALDPELLRTMPHLPFGNPMAYLRTIVSMIGLANPKSEDTSSNAMMDHALDLLAKFPTIIATFDRIRNHRAMLGPRPDLDHAANFLYMLRGEDPSPKHTQALDGYLVLLAEHGFNASTFSARTTVATQSDYYSGIVSALGTLKGPLHGAATPKAMEMLTEIGTPDQVEPFVQKTMADHKRFMGFGHRVYKGDDPRAKHLKQLSYSLGKDNGELKWFEISERLQAAVWKAKQLAINVDFSSASLLHYLGFPTDLFTTLFACARIAGWSAHILEQAGDNRLIRPLALYVGPKDLKFVPVAQRTAEQASAASH